MSEEKMAPDNFYEVLRQQYMSSHRKEEDRENLLFAPFGETSVSFRCLLYLLRHCEGVEPSRLANRMRILRQSATGIADQLERKHYIYRHTHPSDRRKILLMITPEGKEAVEAMLDVFQNYHIRVSSHFTQDELDTYVSLRNRLQEARDQVLEDILAERNAP